jgi:hypothetical protein
VTGWSFRRPRQLVIAVAVLGLAGCGTTAASPGRRSAATSIPATTIIPASPPKASGGSTELRRRYLAATKPITAAFDRLADSIFVGSGSVAKVKADASALSVAIVDSSAQLAALEPQASPALAGDLRTIVADERRFDAGLGQLIPDVGRPSFDFTSWATTYLPAVESGEHAVNVVNAALGIPPVSFGPTAGTAPSAGGAP